MNPVPCYETFEHIATDSISSLNMQLQTFQHKATGAPHFHFAADNPENVFLVGFRTVPTDSTGVAHILEHTALCGSEKYPVRDPFFMMLRRSLNTFMNAMTSSDWTAYPFASCNKKDFDNLLSIYLDATLFSNLDELDFAQEGHRLEFQERENTDSDLEYKGVVFNEMKGAMSSVISVLWQNVTKHLYSHSTYHHNSGGEPADIPKLSYDELRAFYKKHYHPSNAVFMTFGDITAAEHQENFEQRALSRFERSEHEISVAAEPRIASPKVVREPYAASSDEDKSHVVCAWMLGESTDIKGYLEAHLLNGLLLDNSASPLQKALETSEYGSSPSPMCGLQDSNKEMLFMCGLEGCDQADAEKVQAQILSVLEDVSQNGVPQAQIDAVLHQLELHQREIGGDGYPFGLQLILQSLPAVIHRGQPAEVLNIDQALGELRDNTRDPEYVKSLVRRLLLDNSHRLLLTLYPDLNLSEADKQRELSELAEIKASLSDEEKQHIVDQSLALAERQAKEDDPNILPKVGLSDIPAELPKYTSTVKNDTLPQTRYEAGTNGLVYQQLLVSLADFSREELTLLPLYCRCVSELGYDGVSYLDVQQHQAATVGSIGAFFDLQARREDPSQQTAYLTFGSKALGRNYRAQTQLMIDTLEKVTFSEHARIKELINQYAAQKMQSVVHAGHGLAMQTAAASLNAVANFEYHAGGLKGTQALKALSASLSDPKALSDLATRLEGLHRKVQAAPRQLLEIGEAELLNAENCANLWQATGDMGTQTITLAKPDAPESIFWQTNTQVNFCGMAIPAAGPIHPDAGALSVLGGFMRNGFLHTAVREKGGAYGGGASYDNGNGIFRFYSYRDPRLEETFDDFKRAIDWVLDTNHEYQALEEAILGVIGGMDKPGSPAGEVKKDFYHKLYGRTHEQRMQFRERVVNTTVDDIKRVTNTWLTATPNYALISNEANIQAAKALSERLNARIETL